jgi:ribosomal protein L37AE/L43A
MKVKNLFLERMMSKKFTYLCPECGENYYERESDPPKECYFCKYKGEFIKQGENEQEN